MQRNVKPTDLVKSLQISFLMWIYHSNEYLVAKFGFFEKDRPYLLACFVRAENEASKVCKKVLRQLDILS